MDIGAAALFCEYQIKNGHFKFLLVVQKLIYLQQHQETFF